MASQGDITDGVHLEHLLNKDHLSNVSFVVGQAATLIRGHRFLLAATSDVFERMFYGELVPTKEEKIEVPDIEADVFLEMLRFIYGGKPNFNQDNLGKLFYAAEKYNLDGLKKRCMQFIRYEEDKVMKLFAENVEYEFDELNEACRKTVFANPLKLFSAVEFPKLSPKRLEILANHSKLRCHDDQLIAAIEKWSVDQEDGASSINRQEVCKNLIANVKQQQAVVQALTRDYQCKKMVYYNRPFVSNWFSFDWTMQIVAVQNVDIYGIGVFIGTIGENLWDQQQSISITKLRDNNSRQIIFEAEVPLREHYSVYDCLFEKISLNAREKVNLEFVVNNINIWLHKDGTWLNNELFKIVFHDGRDNYTAIAHIMYNTDQMDNN